MAKHWNLSIFLGRTPQGAVFSVVCAAGIAGAAGAALATGLAAGFFAAFFAAGFFAAFFAAGVGHGPSLRIALGEPLLD